jgi:hypothetical protein
MMAFREFEGVRKRSTPKNSVDQQSQQDRGSDGKQDMPQPDATGLAAAMRAKLCLGRNLGPTLFALGISHRNHSPAKVLSNLRVDLLLEPLTLTVASPPHPSN